MKAARITNSLFHLFFPSACSRREITAPHRRRNAALPCRLLLVFWIFNVSFLIRGQTTIDFYLTQFTGATNDTILNITARNSPVIYNGNFYWWPQNGVNFATTNGFVAVTLIPGQYIVSFADIPQSWTITVTNSATPLNAANLTSGITIYNGINSLSGPGVVNDGHGNYIVSITGTSVLTNVVTTNAPLSYANQQLQMADPYQVAVNATNEAIAAAAYAVLALGNAASGDTNTMTVLNATNAQNLTGPQAAIISAAITTNAFSANMVYYIDGSSFNAIGIPNNPLFPYTSPDQISTVSLPRPTTLMLIPSWIFFKYPLTNVTVIGTGSMYNTILVDTAPYGANGLAEASDSAFIIATNNLTYENFTIGWTNAGPDNITNYAAIWFREPGINATNILVKNIYSPLMLPGGIGGGTSLDGWFGYTDASGTDMGSATFINWVGDFPWDVCWDKGGQTAVRNYTLIDCNLSTEGITNQSNPSGLGHIFGTANAANGSSFVAIDCNLNANDARLGYPIYIAGAASAISNVVVKVTGCTLTTASSNACVTLTSASSGPNALSLDISGNTMTTNSLNISSYWAAHMTASWKDGSGYEYHAGNMVLNNFSTTAPTASPLGGLFWPSNGALYWVTSLHTN